MAKILYAEDEAEWWVGCIDFLKKKGYTVYHAEDGEKALKMYKQVKPDLVLLDMMMPKMTGLEVAQAIRKDDLLIPILFLSTLGETMNVVIGLKTGANDYIRKEVSNEELAARIEVGLRLVGFRERSEKVIEINDKDYLDLVNRELVVNNQVIPLTPLEIKIMIELCMNKNCYIPKKALVEAVWGNKFKETVRYLDRHLVNLRRAIPKGCSISIASSWGTGIGLMVKEK